MLIRKDKLPEAGKFIVVQSAQLSGFFICENLRKSAVKNKKRDER
jgi:hypothetical protein